MKKLLKLLLVTLLFFILSGCARKGSEQVLSADNVTISYQVQGQGKPAVVFVHGWCCDKRYWKFQVPYFAKRHKVVTIDLAGHGQSGLGRVDYTIEAFGSDVVAVVEKLDLGEVVLIGHSLGGPVIIEAAKQMPRRVIGCVGADTLHDIEKGYGGGEIENIVAKLKVDFVKESQDFIRQMFPADADPDLVKWVINKMPSASREAGISALRNLADYDLKSAVGQIKVPIYSINADFWPTSLEVNEKYAKSFKLKLMPGIGHFVMMEDPEKFNQLLAETINELRKTKKQ